MTKKILSLTCAAAAFAAPALASSSSDQRAAHKQAVKTCQGLHRSMSKADFKSMYGKNGVAHCVKKETAENSSEIKQAKSDAQQNAAQQCKAERAQDPQAFQTKYGSGKNGKNAYGKCVSQTAKSDAQAQIKADNQKDQNQVNAAKQCRTEQKSDAQAFKDKYGTNHNKSNAFGKCVSQTAKSMNQQQESQQQGS